MVPPLLAKLTASRMPSMPSQYAAACLYLYHSFIRYFSAHWVNYDHWTMCFLRRHWDVFFFGCKSVAPLHAFSCFRMLLLPFFACFCLCMLCFAFACCLLPIRICFCQCMLFCPFACFACEPFCLCMLCLTCFLVS